MIPPKKHKLAIEKLDSMQRCNFSKKTQLDFVDCIDSNIRCCLKHLRELKKPFNRERAFRKVDKEVQDVIFSVLNHLTKIKENDVATDEDESQPSTNQSLPAIMDKESPNGESQTNQSMSRPILTIQVPKGETRTLSPSKLFQQILNKPDSDPEPEINVTQPQKKPRLESTSIKIPHKEDRDKQMGSFLSPLSAVTKDEETLMEEAMSQGPIEQLRRKKQKQPQRRPAAASAPSKLGETRSTKDTNNVNVKKAKTMTKHESQSAETTETETKENAKSVPVTRKKNETKKKPAAVKAPPKTSELTRASDQDPIVLGEHIFNGMWSMKDGRVKVRHRLESRAHHEFFKEFANRDGYDPKVHKQEALARAKKARQAFAVEFEKKWPKHCTQKEAKALHTQPLESTKEDRKKREEKEDSDDEADDKEVRDNRSKTACEDIE
eukprot:Skav208916  [mRNA]  locus=scaffold787:45035:46345:- [translate_table: standard]